MRECHMEKRALFLTLAIAVLTLTVWSASSDAQYIRKSPRKTQSQSPGTLGGPSGTSVDFAKRAANACLNGHWEDQACLKSISENTLVMAANYGAALQKRGKNKDSETLKENCAAATAATKGEYPAYAMRSAYVECANKVYDLTESTKMSPDLSQYQLLVGAVQCLDKSRACKGVESGLAKYK